MKTSKYLKLSIAGITALTLGLSGCGSSDDDTSSSATQTGTFVDSPVQGLHYQTATQNGFTDASGTFKYVTGETVEFKLGNLSLGKAIAGNIVTPYTISDNNDTATNIALLLQNFDGNRSNAGILDLSKLQDYNFSTSDFNLSATPATMKAKIETIFADNSFATYRDNTNNTVLGETDVVTNMNTYIDSLPTYTEDTSTAGINDIVGKTFYSIDTEYIEHGDAYYSKIVITNLVPLEDSNSKDYCLSNGEWVLDTDYEEDSNEIFSIEGNKLKNVYSDTHDGVTESGTIYLSIVEKTSSYWTMKFENTYTESNRDGVQHDVRYEKWYLSMTPEMLDPSLLNVSSSNAPARSATKVNKMKKRIFGMLLK